MDNNRNITKNKNIFALFLIIYLYFATQASFHGCVSFVLVRSLISLQVYSIIKTFVVI